MRKDESPSGSDSRISHNALREAADSTVGSARAAYGNWPTAHSSSTHVAWAI